jgi:hypothetical protein
MMKESQVRKLIERWEKFAKDAALSRDITAWGAYCDWIFAAELILEDHTARPVSERVPYGTVDTEEQAKDRT